MIDEKDATADEANATEPEPEASTDTEPAEAPEATEATAADAAEEADADETEEASEADTDADADAVEASAEEADAPAADADAELEPAPEGAEASEEAEEEEEEAVEPPPPPPDPRTMRIRFLETELAAREETLREYIKAHKKAQGEFDAFKQRLLRDQEREIETARAKAVEPMLDVFDNLTRTLDAVKGGGTQESLLEGVELVARQFLATLERMGLQRLDPTGEPFDPATMNALAVIPVTDPGQVNRVIATIQPGFRLGDREIRPALVQVGRKA